MTEREPKCLFCGKPKSSGKRFIGGGGAIICEDCIRSSNQRHPDPPQPGG